MDNKLLADFDSLRTDTSLWIEHSYRMMIHSQGKDPLKLLLQQHPSESPQMLDWRRKNFTPITKAAWLRGFNNCQRLFKESNYNIKVSNELQDLIDNNNFGHQDIYNFVFNNVFLHSLEDPNAVVITLYINQVPEIKIIPCYSIYHLSDSLIIWGNGAVKYKNGKYHTDFDGKFYYLDRNDFGEITKDKENISKKILWIHGLNRVPMTVLGGDWCTSGYYTSFFEGFTTFGDEAIKKYSDFQVVTASSAYPIKEISEIACVDDCEIPSCPEDEGRYEPRIAKRAPSSPSDYIIRPEVNPLADRIDTRPLMSYITPPVDILKEMREVWQIMMDKAESAIYLNFNQAAQSGTAKAVDREEFYAFLVKVSNNIFDNIFWSILYNFELYITAQYYTDIRQIYRIAQKPVITKPNSFSIKTEEMLSAEFNATLESGCKALSTSNLVDYVSKKYASDPVTLKMYQIAIETDPLLVYTTAEKLQMLSANLVSESDVEYSNELFQHMFELIASFENKEQEFLSIPNYKIIEMIKVEEATEETQPEMAEELQ